MVIKRFLLGVLGITMALELVGCGTKPGEPSKEAVLSPAKAGDEFAELHKDLVRQGMPDFRQAENPAGAGSALWQHLMLPPVHRTKQIDEKVAGVLTVVGEMKEETFRIVQHESGKVPFKGRKLAAGIVKVHIDTIDRAEGVYGKACVIYVNVRDYEFEADRFFNVALCDADGAAVLKGWREETGFEKDPLSSAVTAEPD